MRFREKLLIGVTVIFGLLVAAGIYISKESTEFRNFHESFAREFVKDMSRSWALEDISDRLSEQFLEQAKTPEGQDQLKRFAQLGALSEIKEVDMGKYFSGSDGTLGEFIMKARFEREDVAVKVTVHEQSGEVRVRGVTINRLDETGKYTDF